MICICRHCEKEFDNNWCYKTSICKNCHHIFKNSNIETKTAETKKCKKCNTELEQLITPWKVKIICPNCDKEK